jgi:L-lactate dehydrogenase
VGRTQVTAGGYPDLAGCQVIVVTAGVAQKPGETRLDLLNNNARVFRSIAADLDRYAPDALIVVASNPVDVLTYMMQELSGRPNQRIIGTGTMLDTSRFRSLLGQYYDVNPQSVHGYILAEHGDTEVPAWSTVTIGGLPLVGNTVLGRPFNPQDMDELFKDVRDAAYQIIEGKGYTNWAIGLVICQLVQTILDDRKSIQPISVRLNGEYGMTDVCLSVPASIGMNGVERIIQLDLKAEEIAAFRYSANLMKDTIAGVELSAEAVRV